MIKKKHMSRFKFLVVAFSLSFMISCGQQKRYISYKIKEGETIRDIAKRLDIKTKDLLRLNPDVNGNPAANTVIIIPNPQLNKEKTTSTETIVKNEQSVEKTTPETIEETIIEENINQEKDSIVDLDEKIERTVVSYETHTVEKGQTVYAITKKYGISKDELIALNPEFTEIKNNKLSIGQILKIKKTETKTFISLKEELEGYITHTIQPKETMYSLTRFYNVSKEELAALNTHLPNLTDNQLQVGDVLKIRPISDEDTGKDVLVYNDYIAINRSLKVSFLLPFKANEYESTNAKGVFEDNKLANMVTDFYMGAEIAIDSLKNQGLEIETKVFDTGNRGKNVADILLGDYLTDEDVLIGPFYSDKAELVASKMKSPVVFPHFSSSQNTFSSSKLVKTSPDTEAYAKKLTNYLKSKYTNETIFVVGDGSNKSNNYVNSIVADLKKHDSISTIHVLKPKNNYIKKERFTDKMKPKTHNWVILTSNDNAAVADALNSMIVLPENVTAQVFAVNKNKAYSKVDSNKLARVNFTYVSSNFVDDNDELTKVFTKKYKTKNHEIPSEYAIKGFDITYDILMRLASDKKLSKTFRKGSSMRIANKFDYDSRLFNPTSNNGLFIVKYNKDLSLQRLE